MEYIIEGVTCRSFVINLTTGEKQDFEHRITKEVVKSALTSLDEEELAALPNTHKEKDPDLYVEIYDGKASWNNTKHPL